MKEQKEITSMVCDTETGMCEFKVDETNKPVKIIYFTDPICSSCWGIEPQLRKLKLEYGDQIEIEYRMGGLLPDWGYNSGDISKPSDVAHHWEEASVYYDMPIVGDVWLEDPLESSFPPSIAFKAAQLQDEEKAVQFMRSLRELLFLEKKNIAKWGNIAKAAVEAGLDTFQLKEDFEGRARELFQEDLELARKMRVRGFPTLFFSDASDNQLIVYGSKPYDAYESALLKFVPKAVKTVSNKSWESLFEHYPTLTAKEFSVLAEKSKEDSEAELNTLTEQGKLRKLETRMGALWIK